jgi:hypothetical protein
LLFKSQVTKIYTVNIANVNIDITIIIFATANFMDVSIIVTLVARGKLVGSIIKGFLHTIHVLFFSNH